MESWSISSSGNVWDNLRGEQPPGLLPRSFYERTTVQVARDLLGKVIIVRSRISEPFGNPRAGVTTARIIETEAYSGDDPASHCCRGETPRCAIMFQDPGYAYVYFIYGMYEMLNFVTEPKGSPGAVLIRAVEPLQGEALMRKRRHAARGRTAVALTNGPGRLTRALGIKMSHNGESLLGPALFVVDDGFRPRDVFVSPRVGISSGKDKYWRFFISGHPIVSPAPQNAEARRAS